jgi:hypothetical protein
VSAHEAHRNVSGRFTIGWAIAFATPLVWMVITGPGLTAISRRRTMGAQE